MTESELNGSEEWDAVYLTEPAFQVAPLAMIPASCSSWLLYFSPKYIRVSRCDQ